MPGARAAEHPRTALPPSLPPRGLSRVMAAAYVGVSPTLFDQMVRDGRMPPPFRVNARVLWDRKRVDAALDMLADLAEPEALDDPWSRAAL